MEAKRYKPKIDRLFLFISVPTVLILAAVTALVVLHPLVLWTVIPVDLLTLYLLISPLFGYVELRERTLFVKFGFIMKKEIPYADIRGTAKERKFYSDSMLSLKSSLEHVNIKYGKFDIMTVSVVNNDGFIQDVEERIKNEQSV